MGQSIKNSMTRIIIYIEKVKLLLKFNCQLSFIIKNEKSQTIASTDQSFDLINGICMVNKAISFELSDQNIRKNCKKLKIIVMIISTNGVVSAGYVSFPVQNPVKYEQKNYSKKIQRCQDSNAIIKFMHLNQDSHKTTFQKSYIHNLKFNLFHPQRITRLFSKRSKSRQFSSQRKTNRKRFDSQSPIRKFQINQMNTLRSRNFPDRIFIKQLSPRKSLQYISVGIQDNYKKSEEEISIQQIMKENQKYWFQIVQKQQQLQKLKNKYEQILNINSQLHDNSEKLQGDYMNQKQSIQQRIKLLQLSIKQKDQMIMDLEKSVQKYNRVFESNSKTDEKYRIKQLQIMNKGLILEINQLINGKQELQFMLSKKQQDEQPAIEQIQKKNSQIQLLKRQLVQSIKNLRNKQEQNQYFIQSYQKINQELSRLQAYSNNLQEQSQNLLKQLQKSKVNDQINDQLRQQLKKSQQKIRYIESQLQKLQNLHEFRVETEQNTRSQDKMFKNLQIQSRINHQKSN